jgi:energy-coupling factor transporter ATP-binding protein EcfA2
MSTNFAPVIRDNNGFRTAYPARNAPTNTAPVATGFAGNLWGATVGCNWKPTANWIVRPELSGGQQRRAALALALAAEPAVILADEPTGELDTLAAGEVTGILARLRADRSTTIVIVTHDPALAAIADRRLWMERGRCTVLTDAATPPIPHGAVFPLTPELAGAAVFEPPPADLSSLRPAIGEGSLARSSLPFLGGLALSAAAVALFDGLIAYFISLRDPRRTEDEIRRANGWGDKATVPLWIAMPSH